MPHMYILRCADGSYYVGSTWDIDRRLWQHNNGIGCQYTRRRRPVEIVYAEWFDRIDEAYAAEKRVQGWSRRKREILIYQGPGALAGSGSRAKKNPPTPEGAEEPPTESG